MIIIISILIISTIGFFIGIYQDAKEGMKKLNESTNKKAADVCTEK